MKNDVFTALALKRSRLAEAKNEVKDEYEKKLKAIDAEIKKVDAAIKTMNEALEPYLCPTCNGSGTERYCDAAGDMDDMTCRTCHGTGIKTT